MNKKLLYFFTALLFLQLNSNAQTLTASNFNPLPGDGFSYKTHSSPGSSTAYSLSPGGAGAGQFWDFSTLQTTTLGNFAIVPKPATVTGSFSSATAVKIKTSGGPIDFYCGGPTTLTHLGMMYSPNPSFGGSEYTQPEIVMVYPFSLNSTNTQHWSTTGSVQNATTTLLAVATGTLVTSYGTYTNVLRVYSAKTLTNNGYSSFKETYSWYAPGVHFELLSMTTSTATQTMPADTNYAYSTFVSAPLAVNAVGIEKENASEDQIMFFPNPASNELTIRSTSGEALDLEITNTLGKQVMSKPIFSQQTLDVSDLASGVYVINVHSGKNIQQKKLLIAR